MEDAEAMNTPTVSSSTFWFPRGDSDGSVDDPVPGTEKRGEWIWTEVGMKHEQ